MADQHMEDVEDVEREKFDAVVQLGKQSPEKAVPEFLRILNEKVEGVEGITKFQEWSIFHLADLYAKLGQTQKLIQLLADVRPLFVSMPKAKTAKIVRTVVDALAKIPNTSEEQISLCKEYIEWCIREKRAFLRQRIQTRLANLYLTTGRFSDALKLLGDLQSEVKKLDDKTLLVEIFLIESRVHHALRNVPRSKSSLTAARSVANSIYVGPLLQGEIDMQGGILNAEEKDFRTGYSYFFEAFEGFVNLGDARALPCLKYMLLCKIMNNQGDEVPGILNAKNTISFTGPEIDCMRAIAKAYKERSLHTFDAVLQEFKDQIVNDSLVQRHLKDLQATLLEQNLLRIIEPYSRVEIAHVAKLIDLPVASVETRLSKMILDKKFHGILDQGSGELVVFDDPISDSTYEASLNVVTEMSNVVDSLFRRTEKLHG